MPDVRLKIRHAPRDPVRFPADDDALGDLSFTRVKDALNRGLPRPALMVVGPTLVDWIDIAPVLHLGPPHAPLMVAALAGQPENLCAGLLGVMTLRRGDKAVGRAAVVFLEWPDNRWWTAWQPLDRQGVLIGEAPSVRRAVDGWPRPGGVGGWFAAVRRLGLKPRLEMLPPQDGWVH